MEPDDVIAAIGIGILAGIGAAVIIKILSDMANENAPLTEEELQKRIREQGDLSKGG